MADPDVWRCMSGNEILDPCFADGTTVLACDPQPWNGKVTLLRLTRALPVAAANPRDHPGSPPAGWAIQLGNGDRCFLGTGANGEVSGVPLVYYCDSGNAAGPPGHEFSAVDSRVPAASLGALRPVPVTIAWAG